MVGKSILRSIRFPATLLSQLKDRARITRRSVNAEVVHMLEQRIDEQAAVMNDLAAKMRRLNQAELRSLAEGEPSEAPPAKPE